MSARPPFDHTPNDTSGVAGTSDFRADAFSMEEDRSTKSILRELMREVPNLFTKELALARAEMRENLQQTRRGAMEVSAGGVVLLGGYGLISDSTLPAWIALVSAIVGTGSPAYFSPNQEPASSVTWRLLMSV